MIQLRRQLTTLVEGCQEAIELLREGHARPGSLHTHRISPVAQALYLGLAEPELIRGAVARKGRWMCGQQGLERASHALLSSGTGQHHPNRVGIQPRAAGTVAYVNALDGKAAKVVPGEGQVHHGAELVREWHVLAPRWDAYSRCPCGPPHAGLRRLESGLCGTGF